MCLQGIKKQISDRLDNCNKLINDNGFEFVDDCHYLEIDDITDYTLQNGNLNILQLNTSSLLNKQAKLQSLLNKLERSSEIHCFILCETWLTKETKNLFKLNNYTYVGTEHCNKKGGGVGFLIRNNVIIRDRADLQINSTTFEHHIIELKCRKRNILLVSLYCLPNTSVKSFHDEYKQLLNKLNEVTSCDVILGLDHNLDFLKSNNHKDTQNFIELNLEKNLLLCITRPT